MQSLCRTTKRTPQLILILEFEFEEGDEIIIDRAAVFFTFTFSVTRSVLLRVVIVESYHSPVQPPFFCTATV